MVLIAMILAACSLVLFDKYLHVLLLGPSSALLDQTTDSVERLLGNGSFGKVQKHRLSSPVTAAPGQWKHMSYEALSRCI
eukprot:62839-Prorocentrum_lima.AAC.1